MGSGRKDGHLLITILAVVGALILIAGILIAVYRFFAPEYYLGYDDDEDLPEAPEEELAEENDNGEKTD